MKLTGYMKWLLLIVVQKNIIIIEWTTRERSLVESLQGEILPQTGRLRH